MNFQKLVLQLMKMGKKSSLIHSMTRKKSNNGMLWVSILSVGLSIVAYGIKKKGPINLSVNNPIDTIMNKMSTNNFKKIFPINNQTILAEFANEIKPQTENRNHNANKNTPI